MEISVFNLKINDLLTSMDSRLLPIYRSGDIYGLFDYYDKENAFSTLKTDTPEIDLNVELDMSAENPHDTDCENVKRLYGQLKALPAYIAAKPEFWGCYAHAFHADYVVYRSETKREEFTKKTVLRDFFCRSETEQPRRMLVVNLLSRLWWTGRLMYDDKNENPYHFVDMFTKSSFNSRIVLLASSTACGNHDILMGLLDAVEEYKLEHGLADIARSHFVPCTKHLNSIGAVRMIDTLSREEIKDICRQVIDSANVTR